MIEFKDRIEFDEPRSLEEAIRKLKHCYKKSKRRYETKPDWKGNNKNKGKWYKKQARPQNTSNKEDAAPYNKFNKFDRGQEYWFEQNKRDDRKPIWCCTCGKDHLQRDCPQHQGGRLQIYNS